MFARIEAVVRKTFAVPNSEQIRPNTTSTDVAGWDSLSYAALVMNVEETFDIELPLDRIYDLRDVGELCDLVRKLTAMRARPEGA